MRTFVFHIVCNNTNHCCTAQINNAAWRIYMANKTDAKRYKTSNEDGLDSDMSRMISSAIAQKKKAGKKKKKNKGIVIGAAATGAVIVVGAVVYFGGWINSMGKFLPNTYINDTDVSGMTPKQAASAIQVGPTTEYLTVTKKDGDSERIPLDYFDYKYDLFADVKEIFDQIDYAGWVGSYFKTTNYTTESEAQYDSDKLEYLLRSTVWGSVDTSDAKIKFGDDGYYIEPEVYGDTVNIEILTDYVEKKVSEGALTVDLTDSGCYTEPKVLSADLQDKLEEMKEKFNFIITYDFDYTTETLTGADVSEWVKSDGSIDRSKAENYIAMLAQKYDTFMTTRSFRTTERGVITMAQSRYSTGQYGWWIDQEKSVDKLLQYIENGESITVDPMYVTLDTGYCYEGFESDRSADSDIGNTYIEVDLSAQHMWYYENGELKFETDQIVSGKATDPARKTPEGVYSVYTKSENYMMVAADGSYRTRCSYFMRCSFEGIGFHDLSRSSYGGDIYINNGSHGCINMKYSEVQTLYNMVARGTPVIMYY